MEELKVGDWIIGPPDNIPVKILKLNSNISVDVVKPCGELWEAELNIIDRLATAEEVGQALYFSFIEKLDEEAEACLDMLDLVVDYIGDEDCLYVNGIRVYKDGKFIQVL